MNQPHQPHQPKVPNSFNSWMASLLESALVTALTPIVERLDRIEDWVIAQPPIAQEQLNYVLEPISQQLANQQRELSLVSSALDELATSGEILVETLNQREQDRNQQLTTLTTQVEALIQTSQQQRQQIANLSQSSLGLVKVLLPLPEETHNLSKQLTKIIDSLSRQIDNQDQDITAMSNSLGELALRLTELVKALQL